MRTSLPLVVLLGLACLAACGPAAPADTGLPRPDAGPALAGAGHDAGGGLAADAGASPAADAGAAPGGPLVLAGSYDTRYQLDLGAFAADATEVSTLLDVLRAVLDGQGAACGGQPGLEAQLLCLALGASLVQARSPPWLGELVAVLSDLFRLGATPLRAAGVLVLTERAGRLAASETWTSLQVEQGGRALDLLAGPPGAAGPFTVAVPNFEGTRGGDGLTLGPRRVELDAEALLVRLLGVAIAAGSGGRVHDVAGLLDLVLCRPLLGRGTAEALACLVLTRAFADRLELRSRLGLLAIASQAALPVDGRGSGLAWALGSPASPGVLRGALALGPRSWPLGPAPGTAWLAARRHGR